MPCAIEVGLGLLKLKQEAPRLIILNEFGNLFANNNNNNNSKSPSPLSSSDAGGNRRALFYHPHLERKGSRKRIW
jgi:hypothetical protein